MRVPSPHPRSPLWPSVLPSQQQVPSAGRQTVSVKCPGFPQRPWAPHLQVHCLRQHPHTSLDLRPTMTPWVRTLCLGLTSSRHSTVLCASVPSMEMYPLETGSDPHRACWQGRAEYLSRVTQQGRGRAADTGAPATDPAHPGHFQISCMAPGGPPRPGRLRTHTWAAGAQAADLWP